MTGEHDRATPDPSDRVGAVELRVGALPGGASIRLCATEPAVAVARQFVAGMAEALGVEADAAEDMKLAATEAATNVVMHAYPAQAQGMLEVEMAPAGGGVLLTIRDGGAGPSHVEQAEETGFGLSLMRAVADSIEVREASGGGTDVEARFDGVRRPEAQPAEPGPSAALRRVLAMMAAHVGFTMDRLSDAVLVAETLAAHAGPHSLDGEVRVAAHDAPGELRLRIGPLRRGGGVGLLADSELPAFGGVLERLADGVDLDHGIGEGVPCEYLRVRIGSRA